jgi:hypothetical protein
MEILVFTNPGQLDRSFPDIPEIGWQILEMEGNQTVIEVESEGSWRCVYLVTDRNQISQLKNQPQPIVMHTPQHSGQIVLPLPLFGTAQPGIIRIHRNGEFVIIQPEIGT